MDIKKRMAKLYTDWLSTKDKSTKIKINRILTDAQKLSGRFNIVIEEMGEDGKLMSELFEDNWKEFGKNKIEAKKAISKMLNEEKDGSFETEIGLSYYPIADRSKSMKSIIDENDRDIVIQIRHAVTGGNFTIAEELLKNSWGRLRVKERLGLIEWINNINLYNQESEVPKGEKMEMKKFIEDTKKRTIPKENFIEKFLITAKENMKVS